MSGKYFLNSFFRRDVRVSRPPHWSKCSSIFYASFLVLVVTGCRAPQPVSSTIYKKDSVIYHEKLVPINIPASSVSTKLGPGQYDSLVQALQHMPLVNRTIYMTDPSMQTRLAVFLDSLGRLSFKCETLEKVYNAKLEEKERIIETYRKDVIVERKPWYQEIWEGAKTIVYALIIFIVAGVVFTIVNKIRPRL